MIRKNFEKLIEKMVSDEPDILVRTIPFRGGKIHICYIKELADRHAVSELIIGPLMRYCATRRSLDAAYAIENLVCVDNCKLGTDLDRAGQAILGGETLIFFSNDKQYIVADCKKPAKRPVSSPETTYSYRGPRDAFIEDLDTNLSLLRQRLKDPNLRIEKTEVGARTKSAVAVVYIRDVANATVVNEVKKRLEGIDTDGVYESGELEDYLLNNQRSLFPQMGLIERPDAGVEKLLEGKVLLFIEGSCVALQAPKVFAEFLQAADDRYENKYFGMFMRCIRYLAVVISVSATSYYLALAEYHPGIMPASYIVTFAQMRSHAPFNAFIAVLMLELTVELMREALLRVPVKIGSAIGIVGAIIIGQAASSSGIFTPFLLILVSVGFLATFAVPDFSLTHAFRILKFLIIVMTGFFGFYGFSLAITVILISLVSLNTFGVPYLAPWAPFNLYDFARTLLFKKSFSSRRQQYMQNKDDTRSPSPPAQKNKKRALLHWFVKTHKDG